MEKESLGILGLLIILFVTAPLLLGSLGQWILVWGILAILVLGAFLLIKKFTKNEWLRGIVYILVAPISYFVLFPTFANLECAIESSSPCGIASLQFFGLFGLAFLIIGIVYLIKTAVKKSN